MNCMTLLQIGSTVDTFPTTTDNERSFCQSLTGDQNDEVEQEDGPELGVLESKMRWKGVSQSGANTVDVNV